MLKKSSFCSKVKLDFNATAIKDHFSFKSSQGFHFAVLKLKTLLSRTDLRFMLKVAMETLESTPHSKQVLFHHWSTTTF